MCWRTLQMCSLPIALDACDAVGGSSDLVLAKGNLACALQNHSVVQVAEAIGHSLQKQTGLMCYFRSIESAASLVPLMLAMASTQWCSCWTSLVAFSSFS